MSTSSSGKAKSAVKKKKARKVTGARGQTTAVDMTEDIPGSDFDLAPAVDTVPEHDIEIIEDEYVHDDYYDDDQLVADDYADEYSDDNDVDSLLLDVEKEEEENRKASVRKIIVVSLAILLILLAVGYWYFLIPKVEAVVVSANPQPYSGSLSLVILCSTRFSSYSGPAEISILYGTQVVYSDSDHVEANELVMQIPFSQFVIANGDYSVQVNVDDFEVTELFQNQIGCVADNLSLIFDLKQVKNQTTLLDDYWHQLDISFIKDIVESPLISGSIEVLIMADGVTRQDTTTDFLNRDYLNLKFGARAGNFSIRVTLTNDLTSPDCPYHVITSWLNLTLSAEPIASFTWEPNQIAIYTDVGFNAGASQDPDGSIVDYRWDFDMDVDSDSDGIPDNDIDGHGKVIHKVFSSTDAHSSPLLPGQKYFMVNLTVVDNSGNMSWTFETLFTV